MTLGQSLVMTKLFINAAIEIAKEAQEFKVMNKALMRTYRSAAKKWNYGHDHHVTDEQVMIDLKVPNLSMLLVRARLLYLPRLLKRGPNIRFALLQGVVEVQDSWPDMIIKDMSWMHVKEDKLSEMPTLREGLQ